MKSICCECNHFDARDDTCQIKPSKPVEKDIYDSCEDHTDYDDEEKE